MKGRFHGGDRYRNKVKLDFSVNTNPMGMPDFVKRMSEQTLHSCLDLCCEWYPDPECDKLREALAVRHHIPKERIVCGNGACELIYAVVNVLARTPVSAGTGPETSAHGPVSSGYRRMRAVLPIPSFGEYEQALRAADADITYYPLKEERDFMWEEGILEALTPGVDLLFLCNPNNPTGNKIQDGLLHVILRHCMERKITVLLDECFLELALDEEDGNSVDWGMDDKDAGNIRSGEIAQHKEKQERKEQRIAHLTGRYPNVVILKAFTKLYAMPGLRLGYCVSSDRELLRRMRGQMPCWNVSGIAQFAGLTVLDSENVDDYISQSVKIIKKERNYLQKGLTDLGFYVVPGCANFLCFSAEHRLKGSFPGEETARDGMTVQSPADPCEDLYERLLASGILIRDCSSFRGLGKGWYRIGVRLHQENERLLQALENIGRK